VRTRGAAAADGAVEAVDDAGDTVRLARPARRIVALMPSATETLLALGARDRLVGRTDFDAGLGLDSLPSVGGGLDPSLETLVSLQPDLVIAWRTERPELADRLRALGIPVFSLATEDTADVFRAIAGLGRLTGRGAAADSLAASIRGELEAVRASVAGRPRPTVFYMAWYDPPITAGPETFIAQLVGVAGGRSAFPDAKQLWPNVSLEEIVRRQPEVLLVPAGEQAQARLESLRTSPGWRELRVFHNGRAVLLPAELVNHPGPNLGRAARAFRDAIHPERDVR
jgi:cobalamin transport system substrate-binding protein